MPYPQRLHHETPGWVKSGATFHLRLRVAKEQQTPLIDPVLGKALLSAFENYHERQHWHCSLTLLMPDHVHALIAFPVDGSMTRTVGAWKRYTTRFEGVRWQTNFFDHRIRHDREFAETWHYILRNPVAKSLCQIETEWPWSWRPDSNVARGEVEPGVPAGLVRCSHVQQPAGDGGFHLESPGNRAR